MRSREAWLTAITAAFGLSEGCHRSTESNPGAALDVASAASATASAVASADPSAAATDAVTSTPSASVALAASASQKPATVASASLLAVLGTASAGNLVDLSQQAICGASVTPNPVVIPNGSCGGLAIHNTVGIGGLGTLQQPQPVVVSASVNVQLTSTEPADQRAIAAARPRLRACANRAVQQNPADQGTLHVTISVAPSGEVSGVDIVSNSGLSAMSMGCMVAQLRRLQFAPTSAARQLPATIAQAKL